MAIDVAAQIRSANAGRDPQRLQIKYRAMRASPFAFLRGTCALFYARLPRGGVFKAAPAVWACGDLHLENFGSYKADNRLTYFDINDFDESALAPASWDLVRLLTSLMIGADALGVSNARARRLCQVLVEAYGAALASGRAYWVERDTATGLVQHLLDDLRDRKRPAFLNSRSVVRGTRRMLRADGRKALAASDSERALVADFMRQFAKTQADPDFYAFIDAARRIAGTGSLGVERYVILVQGRGSPDGNHLLDLKLALPSAIAPRLKLAQPRWKTEAQRIVEVQQRAQAAPVAFLQPVFMDERAFVLRGLQPSEDRVGLDHSTAEQLEQTIATMGRIVAWSQLRASGRQGSAIADELIDFGRRKKWKAELLDAAQECAAQVRQDAATYNAAWDDGAFG
ncbi:MAG TPA: DUF2252 family protein [Burkholderiaceae bacterium]|nr:DUF2252 family protein [Burkholderiaceae bacterium]